VGNQSNRSVTSAKIKLDYKDTKLELARTKNENATTRRENDVLRKEREEDKLKLQQMALRIAEYERAMAARGQTRPGDEESSQDMDATEGERHGEAV